MRVVGRYAVYDEIGHGGMAAVHFGRLFGHVGFSRTVAVKMLHPQFAKDPAFVSMFLDEARLAARVVHPHVAQTIDVVSTQGELFVVMEYIHGESLARLMRDAPWIPPSIAVAILSGILLGLHAAHEAKSTRGEPLDIVHRDVSPDNVLVGVDGIAKVADFGIAKARGRYQTTRTGELKGKLAYMAPEQLEGITSRLTDVFATAVVLWEILAGKRLFDGVDDAARIAKVRHLAIDSPRLHAPQISEALERVVMRGLERDAAKRFPTALEMATALQKAVPPASPIDVAQWVESAAAPALSRRTAQLARIEHPEEQAFPSLRAHRESAPPPEKRDQHDQLEQLEEAREEDEGEPTRAVPGLARADASVEPGVRPRRALGWWVAGLMAVGLVLAYYANGSWHASAPPAAAQTQNAVPSAPPNAIPAAVVMPEPIDSSIMPEPVHSSTPPPPAASSAARPKAKARSTRPRADDCSPAYTIGSDGLRHYKPECW